MTFESPYAAKLIYVFGINYETHKGCLKIGEATVDSDDLLSLSPNCKALNEAAKKRIRGYTQTAGIAFQLMHTELAIYSLNKKILCLKDSDVHEVLKRSGIRKKAFDIEGRADEWFVTDLETAKKAIKAAKEGRASLLTTEISNDRSPIVFRPEQREAIEKTKRQFQISNRMLWNAKMRFGKTLSALQVVKDLEIGRTLILTHRPVVNEGWYEDFNKIFYDRPEYAYGSKNHGESHENLEKKASKKVGKYVFFASMQDLRGSSLVGGNFDKNDQLFKTQWDLIIVDEAHEGTKTELGTAVQKELLKKKTKLLGLSGTPFNLLDDFEESEIYTWDYVMEQKAKLDWDKNHFGAPNPYAGLPKLEIYTYNLGELFSRYSQGEVAFNFKEFFRTNEQGNFIHHQDIESFINLLVKKDDDSLYPFSTEEYRNNFRHTLWMLPGVAEARALSTLLKKHPVFSSFTVVNVAGDGDLDEESQEALTAVNEAIGENPDETRTITLSCGRLTTGVSVKPWTAVLMLSGSYNTAASSYMQTIFRVQTPATINGRVKEKCYVFDFAPDRTLKVISDVAKINSKPGKTSGDERKKLGEFLNFCPVIAIQGSKMKSLDVPRMLEQLKRVYIERVVRSGFEDNSLYNDELLKLDQLELAEFDNLKKIIGQTKAMEKTGNIDINNQGLTDEQYKELEDLKKKKKKKKELSEEEKERLEELSKQKKTREAAISILRGLSIRMPLMIYGAEIKSEDDEITIDNFTSLIDDQSWVEFMPARVTKEQFEKFKKYYDPEIFSAAGKRIRELTRAADNLSIEERISRITSIFSTFRNPDKETVLTPWRVVNLHLGDCIGGFNFYQKKYENRFEDDFGVDPYFIDKGEITKNVFNPNAKVLEINSKSGLYPLYMAYSFYRNRKSTLGAPISSIVEEQKLWDSVLQENIFVVCKTPMAKSITKRTLIGFRNKNINAHYVDNLIGKINNKPKAVIEKITNNSYWKQKGKNPMKFNAIVGNPPYHEMDSGNANSAKPIYHKFVDISKQLRPAYLSMIMPARWFIGGKGLDAFRQSMLTDEKVSQIFDYPNFRDLFPTAEIAGGICYFLWDDNHRGDCNFVSVINGEQSESSRRLDDFDVLVRDNNAPSIIKKIQRIGINNGITLSSRVSSRKPFGIATNYEPLEKGIPCWFRQKFGFKFADAKHVTDANGYLNKWKLLVPSVPIAGQQDFTKPVAFYYDENVRIAKPGECCSETYLVAGAFDTEEEVNYFKSYLFTKIVRYLLLQGVISQHVNRECFMFVPDLPKYDRLYDDDYLRTEWGIEEEEWKIINSKIK